MVCPVSCLVLQDRVLRQMILAQAPELTTLLVYFACDTEGAAGSAW